MATTKNRLKVSARGVKLVATFEGFRSHPYWDSYGRVWTIGFGETKNVGPRSHPITRQKALELLRLRLNRDYGAAVNRLVRVHLKQHEFDALTDFAYNEGVGALENSTLLRKLNAGDRRGAAKEFLRWNSAGGRVLVGLSRRRRAEKALFLGNMRWFSFYTFGGRRP